jgi:RimJ/RimL family protein N-acetyltransferase
VGHDSDTLLHVRSDGLDDEIRTLRLVGRRPSERDVPALFEIYSIPAVTRWLSVDGRPRTQSDVERMVRSDLAHWEMHGFGRWYWFENDFDTLIARCGPRLAIVCGKPEVEVGWALRPDKEGHGYATEAATAATAASLAGLSLTSVVAYAHVDNHASLAVMGRVGFTFEHAFVLNTQPMAMHRRRASASQET